MEHLVLINNRLGLHARAAAKLVNLAKRYSSDIFLETDNREVDAKSIVSVLMLAAGKGTRLKIYAAGQDEQEAVTAVVGLIENKFGECD